ncbi:hypothetical protein [Bradyrhizobium sp. STM 3557]|uniref:hypothetical protein n=1 Tax=Bradyrhizobium sp. STM 3557 TaxID=578920 RepID=UPI00388DDF31
MAMGNAIPPELSANSERRQQENSPDERSTIRVIRRTAPDIVALTRGVLITESSKTRRCYQLCNLLHSVSPASVTKSKELKESQAEIKAATGALAQPT